MKNKLLTEHHLAFLNLKMGCAGLLESTLVKMPHCWKSCLEAHINLTVSSRTRSPFGSFVPLDFAIVLSIFIASSFLPAATR